MAESWNKGPYLLHTTKVFHNDQLADLWIPLVWDEMLLKEKLNEKAVTKSQKAYSLRGGHTANFCFNSGQVSFKSIIMRRRYNRLVFHLRTTRLYYLPCSYTVNHKISWRALNQEINCKVILDNTTLQVSFTVYALHAHVWAINDWVSWNHNQSYHNSQSN